MVVFFPCKNLYLILQNLSPSGAQGSSHSRLTELSALLVALATTAADNSAGERSYFE
jgi:hypothetical protein